MARLYDPDHGHGQLRRASICATPTLASLRERIVVVPQEGFLFGGTIADNLRIARPGASDDDVAAALDAIGVLERFEGFPEGLATPRSASAARGCRRANASWCRSPVPRSSTRRCSCSTRRRRNLDPGTEAVVERALERLMRGRTVIVVAHRLSTVRRADRIAVVDHGRIAEIGTHDELVATGGRYASLAAAWERTQVAPS